MRTKFLYISVLRVASGPRVKLASCKSSLNPPVVYSTDHSKAVVPVLVLLFVASWFILRGDLFYVLPCVILFLCFSVLLALGLPRLGKRELILVLFIRLFDLCLFGFVGFLFLLVSGKDCGTPWTFLLPFFFFRADSVTSFEFKSIRYHSSVSFDSTYLVFFIRKKINKEICYNCKRGRDRINLLSTTPIRVYDPFRIIDFLSRCSS